jgi:hypothetical protein
MERQIKVETVEGPQGKWRISTIRTDAGGADEIPVNMLQLRPFSSRDYLNETPWPFETVVFSDKGGFGRYHEAYRALKDAEAGHVRIVEQIKRGDLAIGAGIKNHTGSPSLTPAEWEEGKTQGSQWMNPSWAQTVDISKSSFFRCQEWPREHERSALEYSAEIDGFHVSLTFEEHRGMEFVISPIGRDDWAGHAPMIRFHPDNVGEIERFAKSASVLLPQIAAELRKIGQEDFRSLFEIENEWLCSRLKSA